MKALVGSWEQRPYRLLAELTALRSRVRDLEEELQRVREDNTLLRAENDQLQALRRHDAAADEPADEDLTDGKAHDERATTDLSADELLERDIVMSS